MLRPHFRLQTTAPLKPNGTTAALLDTAALQFMGIRRSARKLKSQLVFAAVHKPKTLLCPSDDIPYMQSANFLRGFWDVAL
jgi:hypothetical protein